MVYKYDILSHEQNFTAELWNNVLEDTISWDTFLAYKEMSINPLEYLKSNSVHLSLANTAISSIKPFPPHQLQLKDFLLSISRTIQPGGKWARSL